MDNCHVFPAFSSFICVQLLVDDEVRSLESALKPGTDTGASARAFLELLRTLPTEASTSSVNEALLAVCAVPPRRAVSGFASLLDPGAYILVSGSSGDASQDSTAAHDGSFPAQYVSAGLLPFVHLHASSDAPSSATLRGQAVNDWVQQHLPGEALLQAAQQQYAHLQQHSLQHAKVHRMLRMVRGWCAAVALLPDPLLLPHTGRGASGTLQQAGDGPIQRQPASSMTLQQLRVHSKVGLYKVDTSRLVSLAPTPRTYATLLAACLEAGVTSPLPRLLLQLERTSRPSVQQWALGHMSALPDAAAPLHLGLPPLSQSAMQPATPASGGEPSPRQPTEGHVDVSLLVFVLQEGFLRRLVGAGVLQEAALSAALAPPPTTPQMAMLTAARCAALGNQKGSKHGGAVVQPDTGRLLVSGHNHSYTAPHKAHDVPLGHRFFPSYTAAAGAGAVAGGETGGAPMQPALACSAKRPRRDELQAAVSGSCGTAPLVMTPPVLPSHAEGAALTLPPKLLHSRRNKVMHAEVHCISRLAVPYASAETAAYPAAHPLPVPPPPSARTEAGDAAGTAAAGAAAGSCDVMSQADAAARATAAAVGVVHAPPDSNITLVRGCDVWVVELDAAGVGFEEAVPCTNCNVALIQQGVHRVRYTCHTGVHTQRIRSNERQPADTLQFGVHARVLNWLRHCAGLPAVCVPGGGWRCR